MSITSINKNLVIPEITGASICHTSLAGSGVTDGAGGWTNILTATISLENRLRHLIAIATFETETASGAAATWLMNVRITINGSASSTYTTNLAGADDKALGALSFSLADQTGDVTITFDAQDDGSHTANVNPIEIQILGT